MPNPHYQRVLEQDRALPAPVRWLSRAMSSWWTIGVLGVFVVGYVVAAHYPIGGRYVWQWRAFDTTQQVVLTWWPLLAAAWLLAAVVLWSAIRRLPWRIDNLGAFIAAFGLVIILISQSWAFHSQSVGVAAVPVTPETGDTLADALALNYTTRFGDTHDRVLVVMVGGAAPVTIPLEGLPRWNDATGDAMPTIKLHDDPKLASNIGYGTRITTKAYIAEGTLATYEDGTQTAKQIDALDSDLNAMPYPGNALLAIDITADLHDGTSQTTTVWLPFEPEGTDALVPKNFFPVEGLGSIGLAFRPLSKKLPFALAASGLDANEYVCVHVSDTDTNGKLLQPSQLSFNYPNDPPATYTSIDNNKLVKYQIEWINSISTDSGGYLILKLTNNVSNPFILAGLITFIAGVALDRLLDWLGSRPKRKSATTQAQDNDGAAAHTNR